MLRTTGKSMQVAALMLLPASMLLQITTEMRSSVSVMLLLMLFGIALFGLGRLLEGFGSRAAG
ncbi:hypothetical protein NA78x_006032 [Anatilimnocola sp. NA78]|uniref:hypothetical protein n=1 Tax=Anatilimnocola sp. NA78 TaxID=3415683 RepID=UPI003CE4F562